MNKQGLVKAIAEKTELSQGDVEKFLNSFIKIAIETLANGQEISLVGFGSFSRVERSARTGRDFKTGESTNANNGLANHLKDRSNSRFFTQELVSHESRHNMNAHVFFETCVWCVRAS
ncbi:hypothetical protein FACS1894122_08360 [Alphaproteobacteria bacterium]|nr:hypothetical protein FACS1894122_08360 [Alphaproteobacteria bacterium]